jgi:protein-glutamine gamma-glutamyltransferase
VGLLVATVGAFLLWILGKALWRLRLWKRWSRLEPIDRLYQQMTYHLSKQGFVPLRSQTPLEYAQQVSGGVSAEVGGIVSAIAQTYVAWRYGGEQAEVGPLRERWRSVRSYKRRIK